MKGRTILAVVITSLLAVVAVFAIAWALCPPAHKKAVRHFFRPAGSAVRRNLRFFRLRFLNTIGLLSVHEVSTLKRKEVTVKRVGLRRAILSVRRVAGLLFEVLKSTGYTLRGLLKASMCSLYSGWSLANRQVRNAEYFMVQAFTRAILLACRVARGLTFGIRFVAATFAALASRGDAGGDPFPQGANV